MRPRSRPAVAAATTFVVVALAGQLAVGMRASATSDITGDEPFYLLTTQSLASDGDLDVRDEYAGREYRRFWSAPVELWRQMEPAPDGRLLSPHDPGLSLLVLPAYAAAGLRGVQRFLVLVWAGAMACAALLALRLGIAGWAAVLGPVVVGAGPPGIVYASQVYPEAPAALLVGVGLLAVTSRRPRPLAMAAVVGGLGWLGVKYAAVAGVLVLAWAWRRRHDRRVLATCGVVVALVVTHAVWWHLRTFGGLTPYSTNVVWAGEGTAEIVASHVDWSDRGYRLYGLFVDARFGLLRWVPAVALAPVGAAVARRRGAGLPAGVVTAAVLMATFASITIMGWWFPGRMLVSAFPGLAVLVAFGAARLPATAAVLGAWSVTTAAALAWSARTGVVHLAVDPFDLGFPLAPAWAFPDFRGFGVTQVSLSLAWGAGLILLAWRSCSSSTATRSPTAPSSLSPPTSRQPAAR